MDWTPTSPGSSYMDPTPGSPDIMGSPELEPQDTEASHNEYQVAVEDSNDSTQTYDYDHENSNQDDPVQEAPFSEIENSNQDDPVQETPFSEIENSNQVEIIQEVPLSETENSNQGAEIPQNEDSMQNAPSVSTVKHPIGERPSEEPPAKVRKLNESDSMDDGDSCPICLEPWGNSGDHRLTSLKCGHVFGHQCVERWLKSQKKEHRICPTCKSKATVKDLRFIYVRRLVATDTSEITALKTQLDLLQAAKNRTELELQKSKTAHRACLEELERLKTKILRHKETMRERKQWRFALEKNLHVCKDKGCRVMTYNCRTYELFVSQKSSNNLFPGFGIRQYSCINNQLGQFIHLHPKPIRDLMYSQPKDLFLSVSLDSSAKIIERNVPVSTIQAGYPLWSCTWDYLRPDYFYVGGVGGVIQQYDMRNPGSLVKRLTVPGDMTPVVSLRSSEYGLLSCQLNSSWLWLERNSGDLEPRALPVEGPFMSLSYDHETHRVLVSSRPGQSSMERSKLYLCELKADIQQEVICKVEQTFNGSSFSSVMSKSSFVKTQDASWVASHSESEGKLYLHGLDGTRTLFLPAMEPALDLGSLSFNGETILAALSDSKLRIYKAVPSMS